MTIKKDNFNNTKVAEITFEELLERGIWDIHYNIKPKKKVSLWDRICWLKYDIEEFLWELFDTNKVEEED